jgi:hypothetical protein
MVKQASPNHFEKVALFIIISYYNKDPGVEEWDDGKTD